MVLAVSGVTVMDGAGSSEYPGRSHVRGDGLHDDGVVVARYGDVFEEE